MSWKPWATFPPPGTWVNGTRSHWKSFHHSVVVAVPRNATTAVAGAPPTATNP